MAHYFEAGFSVRKPAWHGLGTVADHYPADWTEAREWAGLSWEPKIITLPKSLLVDGIDLDLSGFQVVVRDDTNATLGVTSDEFEPVKNARMGDIVEAVLGAGFKFETAGSLRGGRAVWALAYLDEPFTVAGDNSETFPYLAILNAHDGSGACKAIFTDVRVVCWNTYSAALARGTAASTFTFRHTAGVNDRITEAKAALAGARREASAWQDAASDLFNLKLVNEEEALDHFLGEWEPTAYKTPKKGQTEISDRSREYTDRGRRVFRSLYFDSPTNEAHRGTALGLVDTATEFVDHVQGREAGRFSRFLTGDPRKAQAVKLAVRLAR